MSRLKLPAYGKALLDQRRAGHHPSELAVVWGEDWHAVRAPKVCVKPADFEPGRYDWRVVAGLLVTVHDQAQGLFDCEFRFHAPGRYGYFFDLLGELAEAGAYVVVHDSHSAASLAFGGRWVERGTKRYHWPRWWSDAREARSHAAFMAWCDDRAREQGLMPTATPGAGALHGAAGR